MADQEAVYVNMAKLLAMTAIDLMADDAAQARDIVDNATPKLSKAQYLDFNRSMMATDKFVPEALPMRGAPL